MSYYDYKEEDFEIFERVYKEDGTYVMSKEEFVARMISDLAKRREDTAKRKRKDELILNKKKAKKTSNKNIIKEDNFKNEVEFLKHIKPKQITESLIENKNKYTVADIIRKDENVQLKFVF